MMQLSKVAFLGALPFVVLGSAGVSKATCFDEHSNAGLKFPLIVNAGPPVPGRADSYKYFPASIVASMNLEKLTSAAYPLYWFQWANRCQPGAGGAECRGNRKGNVPLGGPGGDREKFRTFFSSHERADACTLMQVEAAFSPSAPARSSVPGVTAVAEDRLESASSAPATDVCPLPSRKASPEVQGVMLDYEVQDGRSTEETLAFLQRYTSILRRLNKKVILYTNPLNAPTQSRTGINAGNAHAIYDMVDGMTVLLWSQNPEGSLAASLAHQLDLLKVSGGEKSRVVLVFELNGTSMADAKFVHDEMSTGQYKALMIWRNGASVGEACDTAISQKIACLAFGSCSG